MGEKKLVKTLTFNSPGVFTGCFLGLFILTGCQPSETVRYQGKTASQWAPQLRDRDTETRRLASDALAAIGAEGYPYLREEFTNNPDAHPDVAFALGKLSALEEPPELRSQVYNLLLLGATQARKPNKRELAFTVLHNRFRHPDNVREIQMLLQREPDPTVREHLDYILPIPTETPTPTPSPIPSPTHPSPFTLSR